MVLGGGDNSVLIDFLRARQDVRHAIFRRWKKSWRDNGQQ